MAEKYIVSDDRKFIYFVVQKVACSSIKTALLPLFDVDSVGYETTRKDGTTGLRIHKVFGRSGYQIRKVQLVARLDDKYQQYFKFAFVRNPWDRLVSCYCEKLGPNGPGLKHSADNDKELYPGMPFAEFVEAVHAIPDSEANIHFQSQHKVICGSGEDKPILADFVGRFENLKADFDVVAKRISGSQNLQLPHILRSRKRKSRPYTDFYDHRLRDLVRERYQEDIEILDYSY
jgi:chondroitin 4-sulfotransferase 11